MRVADFFCGAGGFSEGFRTAGFEVVFGRDNGNPAIDTHTLNHPHAKHYLGDILKIDVDQIDSIVPDTEVIAGSPPCVSFSYSNKAGKADKSLGTALIEKYFQIVAYKKHKNGSKLKYWLMENVPNSAAYIKNRYTFEELGLPGGAAIALEIPIRNVFNAADYGAPQTRSRFVCGDYPVPKPTKSEGRWTTMRQVMDALGDPLDKPKNKVKDVSWGFEITSDQLTDHRYDTRVEEFEWSTAKRLKTDHGFMGKMSFPEYLDRPSRTVMATQSAISRESILFGTRDPDTYRLPTIREIASFMSFPITYQFEAGSEGAKYRLVGNAVCCKLSCALGMAINEREGIEASEPVFPILKASVDLTGRRTRERKRASRKSSAKFRMHVPYLKVSSLRVDLDNLASDFGTGEIAWRAVLHRGSGKKAIHSVPSIESSRAALESADLARLESNLKVAFSDSGTLTASSMQSAYVGNDGERLGPEKALALIKKTVDETFPEEDYSDQLVSLEESDFCIGRDTLPVRIAAALYSCQWLIERMNSVAVRSPLPSVVAQEPAQVGRRIRLHPS